MKTWQFIAIEHIDMGISRRFKTFRIFFSDLKSAGSTRGGSASERGLGRDRLCVNRECVRNLDALSDALESEKRLAESACRLRACRPASTAGSSRLQHVANGCRLARCHLEDGEIGRPESSLVADYPEFAMRLMEPGGVTPNRRTLVACCARDGVKTQSVRLDERVGEISPAGLAAAQ